MRSYEAYKQKVLIEEPGVKEAYDALQPEFDINQAIIDAKERAKPYTAETIAEYMVR